MVVSWSLAIEEQFYLLWPAVLLWILVSRKNAGRALAFFILGVWVHRAILFVGFHVSYGYIYNAFDTRIDALMIGSLLAILTVDDFLCAVSVPLCGAHRRGADQFLGL
jgi:peptidoglycan/LPS O-acetylase OafA/YrhL